jgi:hypothetical protein
MRLLLGLGALLLAATLQVAAAAATRDQANERDVVSIDPQKSYILFRTQTRLPLRLMREATPQDEAAWRTARAAALARAQAGYDHAVDRYRIAVRDCETRRCRDAPEPPVRATEENFAFPPAEARNFLEVSPGPVFDREGGTFTYLIAVPPGTYAVYGTTVSFGAGPVNMCQCMGSVRFDAPAGRIVDLGVVGYSGIEGGYSVTPVITPVVTPYTPDMARPARLNGLPVIPAELRAVDKIPNYLGGLINRHSPLRGVLRYDGDRVIDDRTGQAPSPRP